MLSGYKTYIIAIATLAYAWGGMFIGKVDMQSAIDLSVMALGFSALRSGVKNS